MDHSTDLDWKVPALRTRHCHSECSWIDLVAILLKDQNQLPKRGANIPIPKLRILNFHELFNQTYYFDDDCKTLEKNSDSLQGLSK